MAGGGHEDWQPLGVPIDVADWQIDEDFGIYPIGSKPKRLLISPDSPEHAFLIPQHGYLFKRAMGWQAQQVWSEIVACRIGALIGMDVPRCFLAVDSARGEVGVLVEFFFRYPGIAQGERFVHAAEFLDRLLVDKKRGRPHSVRTNLALCRALRLPEPAAWWGRLLTFDALIGNTDRHPENWGVLLCQPVGRRPEWRFAPAFDNATSLGYELRDSKLSAFADPDRLERYIRRGKHHCAWDRADDAPQPHIDLCREFVRHYPDARPAMDSVLRFSEDEIVRVTEACTRFDVDVPFSAERANFVTSLISARRRMLADALEG